MVLRSDPQLAPPPVEIAVVAGADLARVEVRGDVDVCNAARLEAALGEAVAAGARDVLVVLEQSGFVAVCGFRALAEAAAVLRGRGGSLTVRCAPASLRIIAGVIGDLGVVLDDGDGRHAA